MALRGAAEQGTVTVDDWEVLDRDGTTISWFRRPVLDRALRRYGASSGGATSAIRARVHAVNASAGTGWLKW
jgi:hypothetical protein